MVNLLCVCVCVFVLLTQDELTGASTTCSATANATDPVVAASWQSLASCDVTCYHGNAPFQQFSLADDHAIYPQPTHAASLTCPIITVTSDVELADVGESVFTADLPVQSDWLPIIQSATSHSCGLPTQQSVGVSTSHIRLGQTWTDADEKDFTVASDRSVGDDETSTGAVTVSSITSQLTIILSYFFRLFYKLVFQCVCIQTDLASGSLLYDLPTNPLTVCNCSQLAEWTNRRMIRSWTVEIAFTYLQ